MAQIDTRKKKTSSDSIGLTPANLNYIMYLLVGSLVCLSLTNNTHGTGSTTRVQSPAHVGMRCTGWVEASSLSEGCAESSGFRRKKEQLNQPAKLIEEEEA